MISTVFGIDEIAMIVELVFERSGLSDDLVDFVYVRENLLIFKENLRELAIVLFCSADVLFHHQVFFDPLWFHKLQEAILCKRLLLSCDH